MAEKTALVLVLVLALVALVFADQAFVRLNVNDDLVLQPPPGGQVVVDGVVFRVLVDKVNRLDHLEAQVGTLTKQLAERHCRQVADLSTITGMRGSTGTWRSGVLAPNGKIYGIPDTANAVIIIDPVTNTADTTSMTGLVGSQKWDGGVLAGNGLIYGIPRTAASVLIIDPSTNTTDMNMTIIGLGSGVTWANGVLANNGNIYGMPLSTGSVLIIDPTTNTADITSIRVDRRLGIRRVGGQRQHRSTASLTARPRCLSIINPSTNTADTTTISGLSGNSKWVGAALAGNSKIYYQHVRPTAPPSRTWAELIINGQVPCWRAAARLTAPLSARTLCSSIMCSSIIDPATNLYTTDTTTIKGSAGGQRQD